MNPPNQKTASIGEMLEFAATSNGQFTKGAKYHLINYILSNIEELKPLSVVPWVSRKWALPAWREIQKIGILDGLELLPMQSPRPPEEPKFPVARIRQLCGLLGLHFNKVNSRIVITRKPLANAPQSKDYADMTPSERSASSPDFGIEIDTTAKLTQFA